MTAVLLPAPAAQGPALRAAALDRAVETLALTLFAEAGTRPVRAIEALAALAVNRARAAAQEVSARLRFAPGAVAARPAATPPAVPWPLLLGRVCRMPFLFPCWNPRHPRHEVLGARDSTDPTLAVCRRIAARAAAGVLPDPTGGGTHWHDAADLPRWALGVAPTAEVAGVLFYRM